MAGSPPSSRGGLSALSQIFDSTLGGSATNIDTGAGGIPGTFNGLLVCIVARGDQAVALAGLNITVNNDTGLNYDIQQGRSLNVTASAQHTLAAAQWQLTMPGSTATANVFAQAQMLFNGYAQTTAFKAWTGLNGIVEATAANCITDALNGSWRNTAAITRLAITANSGNLIAGTRLTIYGVT